MKTMVIYQPATGADSRVSATAGCVPGGEIPSAVESNIREAIGMCLGVMRNRNEPIPEPMARVEINGD